MDATIQWRQTIKIVNISLVTNRVSDALIVATYEYDYSYELLVCLAMP